MNLQTRNHLARLYPTTGGLDSDLNAATDGAVRAVALQPDGKILIGGDFTTMDGSGITMCVRQGTVMIGNRDGAIKVLRTERGARPGQLTFIADKGARLPVAVRPVDRNRFEMRIGNRNYQFARRR